MNKPSESTQMALMSKDISQMQKDLGEIKNTLDRMKDSRYVTQNEMSIAIDKSAADLKEEIKGSLGQIKMIAVSILISVLLSAATFIAKFVLGI